MALSANTPRTYGDADSYVGSVPVKASSEIYIGSAVGITSGYARALNAGDLFVGFSEERATGGSTDGAVNLAIRTNGLIQATITSVAVTDIGKPVYMSDDATFTLTQGSNSKIGRVHRYVTTNTAIVSFEAQSTEGNKEYSVVSIPVTLANITGAGDVLTTWTPGFAGTIEKLEFFVTTAVTTGSKAATLNLEIGTTNLTGGTVALTSANCTPLGALVAGSAITAGNTFGATDTISLEAASVTAFAEGAGVLLITISSQI